MDSLLGEAKEGFVLKRGRVEVRVRPDDGGVVNEKITPSLLLFLIISHIIGWKENVQLSSFLFRICFAI
jgi:hypothetical protein